MALGFWLPFLVMTGCNGCSDNAIVEEDPTGGTDPTAPALSGDVGSWLSMRTMSDGSPAISYYDKDNSGLGFARGTLGSGSISWRPEQVDGYESGDVGKYSSMVVAADGSVWVAYQDVSAEQLKYAKRDPQGVWTVGVADDGGGSEVGHWASIALDASGNPVIAHADLGEGALRVSRWNGSAFSSEVVYTGTDYAPVDTAEEAQEAAAGEYCKLLVDGSTEYIAFYDRAWGALRLATRSGGSWSTEVVDDSGDVGQWPDLMLSGGKLYIAYQDVGNQDLRLAVGSPGSFATELVDGGDHVGADTALFTDGSDLGIVYFDGADNDMKVAKGSPGSWKASIVGETGAAVGFHNETVESGGARYVASYDYTNKTVWFTAL